MSNTISLRENFLKIDGVFAQFREAAKRGDDSAIPLCEIYSDLYLESITWLHSEVSLELGELS
ncbi:hypothetical protein YC2023_036445 [Brassica napus]